MKILLITVILALSYSYSNGEPHECNRECMTLSTPKTCVYNFTIEWYRTLSKACWDCPANQTHCSLPHCVSADGKTRSIITVNRQLPGPAIEVCEGDTVVVYVTNDLEDAGAVTIHWHGLHMKGTPYMDGVPMLTQCSIYEHNRFRYEFTAQPAGTHWYHSHTGFQREEGLYGPVIIRLPSELDIHSQLYDHDLSAHTFVLSDWYPEQAANRFQEMNHRRNPTLQPLQPLSGLINGKTKRYEVQVSEEVSAFTPPEIFHVRAGERYRFRVIAATGQGCQFRVSVDSHKLTVIHGDGVPIKPVTADTVTIAPGERHDFVLAADQDVGNYWMRAYCSSVQVNVLAVVRYEGAPEQLPTQPEDTIAKTGIMLFGQTLSGDDETTSYISVGEIESGYTEDFTNEKVDMFYTMTLAMNNNDNTRIHHPVYYPVKAVNGLHLTAVIDNWEDRQSSWFCNQSSIRSRGDECYNDLCRCTHVVDLPLDKIVELTFVNIYDVGISIPHFMHSHGYHYRVMAVGVIGRNISVDLVHRMKEDGRIQLRYINPIYRDTTTVPSGGYMVIRMKADNPGLWLFHCHNSFHSELGQIVVFKVGDEEDWGPPPQDFPRCGSFGTTDAPKGCPTSTENKCRNQDESFCNKMLGMDCYNSNTRKRCCQTCSQRFYTGIKDCEYGDREKGCRLQKCLGKTKMCCSTCRGYP